MSHERHRGALRLHAVIMKRGAACSRRFHSSARWLASEPQAHEPRLPYQQQPHNNHATQQQNHKRAREHTQSQPGVHQKAHNRFKTNAWPSSSSSSSSSSSNKPLEQFPTSSSSAAQNAAAASAANNYNSASTREQRQGQRRWERRDSSSSAAPAAFASSSSSSSSAQSNRTASAKDATPVSALSSFVSAYSARPSRPTLAPSSHLSLSLSLSPSPPSSSALSSMAPSLLSERRSLRDQMTALPTPHLNPYLVEAEKMGVRARLGDLAPRARLDSSVTATNSWLTGQHINKPNSYYRNQGQALNPASSASSSSSPSLSPFSAAAGSTNGLFTAKNAATMSFQDVLAMIGQKNRALDERAAQIQREAAANKSSQAKFSEQLQALLNKFNRVKLANKNKPGRSKKASISSGLQGMRSTAEEPVVEPQQQQQRKSGGGMFFDGFLRDEGAAPSAFGTTPAPLADSGSFAALKSRLEQDPNSVVRVPVLARQTIGRLAGQMGVRGRDVLAKVIETGKSSKKLTDFIDAEVAELVVAEFGMLPVRVDLQQQQAQIGAQLDAQEWAALPRRGAVICVMGHVDHGKTTLLDTLRRERRALFEAGNITQSIGAFRVDLSATVETNTDDETSESASTAPSESASSTATVLDTPGHAAFRAMRERGANASLTDLIVLVISAVDGLQPQTLEVIQLSQQHGVPLIIAINKCDLPDASPKRVTEQLLMHDVVVEAEGGDVLSVEISAKFGHGIAELKECILLASEMLDLRAPTSGPCNAYVIESRRERSLGCVMNVVVRAGLLKVGDHFVCGLQHGVVRALIDETGARVPQAGPSQGVQIVGASDLEDMTEDLMTVSDEATALAVIEQRVQAIEMSGTRADELMDEEQAALPKEEVHKIRSGRNRWRIAVKPLEPGQQAAIAAREASTLYVILKADVKGSLEALLEYVSKLPTEDVSVQVVRHGLGDVVESDIAQAQELGASVIGFNVNASSAVVLMAKNNHVPLSCKDIIYHCMDEVRDQASSKIPVLSEQQVAGNAEVRQMFVQKKTRTSDPTLVVAGVMVKNGELRHDRVYRVRRDEELLYQGTLRSMRRFTKEVQKVEKGEECGIIFDSFNEFEVGDVLECIEEVKHYRVLDDSAARGFETVTNPKYDSSAAIEGARDAIKKKKKIAQELKGGSTLAYKPQNLRGRVPQLMQQQSSSSSTEASSIGK